MKKLLVVLIAFAVLANVAAKTRYDVEFMGKAFAMVEAKEADYIPIVLVETTDKMPSKEAAFEAADVLLEKLKTKALKQAVMTWSLSEEELIVTGRATALQIIDFGKSKKALSSKDNDYLGNSVSYEFEYATADSPDKFETTSLYFEWEGIDLFYNDMIKEIEEGCYEKLAQKLSPWIEVAPEKIIIRNVKKIVDSDFWS